MAEKFFYIENLGCAKNQVDAEVMAYKLEKIGWTLCETPENATVIIVNTCGFIQSAKEESINTFFELRRKFPKAKIVVAGCLAQRYSSELGSELAEAEADAIFGNRDLSYITEVFEKIGVKKSAEEKDTEEKNAEKIGIENAEKKGEIAACAQTRPLCLVPEYPNSATEDCTRNRLFGFAGSAYLKISEGCNHRCGYCAIPIIRGNLRSLPQETIISEAQRLVSTGVREINLIAQDLAAYGYDWDSKSHFCELLTALCQIRGDFKIRMLYMHPDWITDEIITTVKNNPKILHYFDIPFQHASEKILRPMKRTGNARAYIDLVEKIRREIPDVAIRTTIMLGFPGETDEDFDIVFDFVKECRFDWMGSFVYSREEDTQAFALTDEKTHEKLQKQAEIRQAKLSAVQEKITEQALQKFVGNTYEVLIEELIENEDLAIGRMYAQAPEVDGLTVVMGRNMIVGNTYKCVIRKVNGIDLDAVKIDE